MVKLVIVESPAKCSKIQSYLGDGYKVVATMGHIRALEETLDSVGIDRNWEPTYVELSNKKDAISRLRKEAKGAEVILATDDDREGEGIAWHVCHILKLDPRTTPRIVFHEITKTAIVNAAAHPRLLDMSKVNAQQARAMLDLLVGFTVSKVLWNRVAPKLSAGRCQSPALRLVVERDQEVESHTSSAYWTLSATLKHPTSSDVLDADAVGEWKAETDASHTLQTMHADDAMNITSVKESVSTSNAPKPYITSTLQQDASSLHGLGPKVTMQAAQKLYEAGHITYMRTDNAVLSKEAADAIRAYIASVHGAAYLGPEGAHTIGAEPAPAAAKPKKKKAAEAPEAQAAHEAIRPTHPETAEPDLSDAAQKTVYRLIWRRAVQCQMAASQTDVRKVVLAHPKLPDCSWNAEQSKVQFLGWRALDNQDPKKTEDDARRWTAWKSALAAGAVLKWTALRADEHFTKPKGRYTEASLIAELEKRGIGRPSTFASLVTTILDREYVEKTNVEGRSQDSHHLVVKPRAWPPSSSVQTHKTGAEKNKLRSTPLGRSVSEFLSKEYNDLFNYEFTAAMEAQLDSIAKESKPWKSLLQDTWDKYKERYAAHTSGGSAASKAARERVLGTGVKIILSKKGPLFVRDPPSGSPKTVKATFAPLLAGMAYATATEDDARRAFDAAAEAKAGEVLGMLDDAPIAKKKGPYGFYAEWKSTRVPLKGGESLADVQDKLKAKLSFSATESGGYERKVGDFTIKRGPYGLYFYKHTLKRVSFVKFPPALDPDKVNVADLAGLYSDGLAKKRRFGGVKKDKE